MPETESKEQLPHRPSEQTQKQGASQEHKETTLAKRENVYDDEGRIIDVRFTQDDNAKTLKALLPGTYTVHFYQDEGSIFAGDTDPLEDAIFVDNNRYSSESSVNYTLLHEAGHLVDDTRNRSIYQQFETETDKAKVQRYLLLAKQVDALQHTTVDPLTKEQVLRQVENLFKHRFPDEPFTPEDIMDGKLVMSKMLEECNRIVARDKKRLTTQQLEGVVQAFEQAKQYITEDHPFEELYQKGEEMRVTERTSQAKWHTLGERGAEHLALKAVRELQRQGITVFSGTQADLLSHVHENLENYQRRWEKYLEPSDHRINRGVPLARKRMQEPGTAK